MVFSFPVGNPVTKSKNEKLYFLFNEIIVSFRYEIDITSRIMLKLK